MDDYKEIWKDIQGYEGLYQVSNFGRVRSVDRYITYPEGYRRYFKARIRKQKELETGYLQVGLWRKSKVRYKFVHRLVAQAFIPNPDNLPEVNHKDENIKNNYVLNLEWCTSKYNANYGTRNQRVTEQIKNGKCSKPIKQLEIDGTLVKIWPSISEAGRNSFDLRSIERCLSGEYKQHHGYRWQYLDK